ncbi:MAG: VWA domain-containing protein, partial [Alphaproteobacteria bacterium]|nr:VWA domain-containing protein [Alphaproteobacteria bacterium]
MTLIRGKILPGVFVGAVLAIAPANMNSAAAGDDQVTANKVRLSLTDGATRITRAKHKQLKSEAITPLAAKGKSSKAVKKETPKPQNTAPSKAIMVLDASGSMWGRIGGKAKIAIAREVIGDLVKSIDPSIHLGLSVYGHRRKGDCGDIEHVLPVAPINPKQFTKSVNALQPKGKTPLTEAVRQAAEILKYTKDKATVILISDGKETCGADPCALGRALKKGGLDFTVHIVGFNVPKKDRPGLRCLADATGGQFLTADD